MKNKTDFLLTKHLLLNSVTLIALNDFKEEIKDNNKPLYHALRNKINKVNELQQSLHDLYKQILNGRDSDFFEQIETINDLVDGHLLK